MDSYRGGKFMRCSVKLSVAVTVLLLLGGSVEGFAARAQTEARIALTPDHGSCKTVISIQGINFTPGSETTLFFGPARGDNFWPLRGPRVQEDGTFETEVLVGDFAFECKAPDTDNQPYGQPYAISVMTGGNEDKNDPPGEPSASSIFTLRLPAGESFEWTWGRTDKPVLDGVVARTWMWGPKQLTQVLSEPYAESPDGMREVRYFDKARMEIAHPDLDPRDTWYVTNGLLVVEMIEGRVQTGDHAFDDSRRPADVPVAGDLDSPGITYAEIDTLGLREAKALAGETLITEMIDESGQIVNQKHLGDYSVTSAQYVPETDHTVAEVFLNFMTVEGLVYVDAQYIIDDLFENPFYATGYPITEAYWSQVTLNGIEQDVLWQCFERRCLTYTPSNDRGWQVETGNVGLHYYIWRYGETMP